MSVLATIVDAPPATSIEEVRARLSQIEEVLPAADGVACFNKLYLMVTENLLVAKRAGTFRSAEFLGTLDVAFGNLYFEALRLQEHGQAPPRAWAPLFAARSRLDVAPLQFALAGMNAHINRDLPAALVQAFESLRIEMARPSDEATDFDAVNEVLSETESSAATQYFTPLMQALHRACHGVDDVVANWSLREARAAAWTNGSVLWHLRATPRLYADYLDVLDGSYGFAGRGLLLPTL